MSLLLKTLDGLGLHLVQTAEAPAACITACLIAALIEGLGGEQDVAAGAAPGTPLPGVKARPEAAPAQAEVEEATPWD